MLVNFYFEKKRAMATGIAVCGSGFGTFLCAPFAAWLQDSYGWRGAHLIIGGLVLNCCVSMEVIVLNKYLKHYIETTAVIKTTTRATALP